MYITFIYTPYYNMYVYIYLSLIYFILLCTIAQALRNVVEKHFTKLEHATKPGDKEPSYIHIYISIVIKFPCSKLVIFTHSFLCHVLFHIYFVMIESLLSFIYNREMTPSRARVRSTRWSNERSTFLYARQLCITLPFGNVRGKRRFQRKFATSPQE